ncbi:uncharacterized protein LOC144666900 isoform X3 [Oculina patagonica]
MDAIRKKTPSRYQLYLTCIIALVILIIYAGFTVLPNKNRPPSKIASKPCLKDAFKDILLVIFYNYPFYDSIPHLVALYKPAFPNLLFCGPPGATAQPDIPTVDKIKDFLGYECLGRAIREHPGYAGYFFISDDVILKYWNFPDFDRNKFWESYHPTTSPASGPASSDWYWYNAQYGLSNCRRALEDVAKMFLAEKKLNGTQFLDSLLKNGNEKLLCFGGRWDVLYVPQRHATAFSILSETFYKQQVFLEIAVPTIYRLLERNQNIALLPGYFIPGNVGDPAVSDSRFFWYFYFLRKEYYFIHPFKLHRGGIDSKFSLVMMKHIFINKIKALTNCTPTLL